MRFDQPATRRAVGVALLVLAIVLPLLRQRGTPSWQTVWAEDGSLFTQQAVNAGGFHVLLRGYNSYLELPSRLLALPTPWFSLRYLALYCSLVSVVVGALLAWGVFHWSRGLIGSPVLRVALASLVVLMPSLGPESTATITNVIWLFLAALPWALISPQERTLDVVFRSVVAFLAAASSLLALFFLPLAAVWLIYRRTRAAIVVACAFAAGAILQVGVSLTTAPPFNPPSHRSFVDLVGHVLEGIGAHVFGAFLLGTRWEMDLGNVSGLAAVLLPTVVVVALLIAVARGSDRRSQVLAGACVATAVVLFAGEAWGRAPWVYDLSESGLLGNARYSVAPVVLVASAFALLISGRKKNPQRATMKTAPWLLVAQTALVIAGGFAVVTVRGADTPWIGRVDHAIAHQCAHRPPSTLATVANQGGFTVFLGRTFPYGLFPVTVPCGHLS